MCVCYCSLPKPESIFLSLLANGSVIAVIKLAFAALLIPRFARCLTTLKYGTDPVHSPACARDYNKSMLATTLIFEVLGQCLTTCPTDLVVGAKISTVLLAPASAVLWLDERYLPVDDLLVQH